MKKNSNWLNSLKFYTFTMIETLFMFLCLFVIIYLLCLILNRINLEKEVIDDSKCEICRKNEIYGFFESHCKSCGTYLLLIEAARTNNIGYLTLLDIVHQLKPDKFSDLMSKIRIQRKVNKIFGLAAKIREENET